MLLLVDAFARGQAGILPVDQEDALQVVAFFRQRQTFTQTDDTELLAFFSYQTDLAGGNFAIDPWFAFLSYSQYSCSLVIVPVGTQT